MTNRTWILLGSALGIAGTAPAFAQNTVDTAPAAATPAAVDTTASASPDDIVVTARRREESAQTVPVSITALTSTALAEKSVRSLSDLTSISPGIRFVAQGGANNMNVVLRGLQRVPIGDSPNAVINYFAGIPLNFNGSNVPTYDLEGIQVYKGPQGTLFGRNAIGGAVVINPRAPTYAFGGYAMASYGNYDYKTIEGAVNVPLVNDILAVRVAGKLSRRDGYTKNLGNGPDFGNVHQNLFRISVLFEPNENIKNVFIYDYFKGREVGTPSILTNPLLLNAAGLPTGLVRNPLFVNAFNCSNAPTPCNPIDPNRDIDAAYERQVAIGPYKVYANSPVIGGVTVPYNADRDIWGIANTTDFKVGDNVTVRNIFGLRSTETTSVTLTSGFSFTPNLFQPSLNSSNRQLSDELQVLGTAFDDRLDFIIGGFYLDEKTPHGNGTRFLTLVTNAAWTESYTNKQNKAAYGQIGFKLFENLKLNAGIRYNEDDSNVCTGTDPSFNPAVFYPAPPLGPKGCRALSSTSKLAFSGSAVTYTLGADWQVTRNVFAYITHRKGYREGGVNTPGFTSPCTTGTTSAAANCLVNPAADLRPYQTYEPEKLTDFEAGVKTNWRVGGISGRFNISAFTGKYANVVTSFNTSNLVRSTDASNPTGTSIAINTGSRRLSGFESELVVRPFTGLTLSDLSAYTKQKILSSALPPINGLQPPSLSPASPKFSNTASLRYELPFGSGDTKAVFNADYYWQGSYFVGNAKEPSYDLANARLEVNNVVVPGLDVGVFVKNVFDNAYIVQAGASSFSLGFFSDQYGEPRVYGLEVKYTF